MDSTTDAIREDLEATRDRMTQKLGQIESRVKDQVDDGVESVKHVFDIGDHVNERPWVALGVSFLAGCVLASLEAPRRPRSYEAWRSKYLPASGNSHLSAHGFDAGAIVTQASSAVAEMGHQVTDRFGAEMDMVKAATVATLTGLARDWLKETMPAFGKQFERVLSERRSGLASTRPSGASPSANGSTSR